MAIGDDRDQRRGQQHDLQREDQVGRVELERLLEVREREAAVLRPERERERDAERDDEEGDDDRERRRDQRQPATRPRRRAADAAPLTRPLDRICHATLTCRPQRRFAPVASPRATRTGPLLSGSRRYFSTTRS